MNARLRVGGAIVGCAQALAVAQQPPPLSPAFESYVAHIAAAEGALARGNTGAARRWLEAVPIEHRAFEWQVLAAESDQSLATFALHEAGVSAIAVSPDGTRIATGASDGVICLWDAAALLDPKAAAAPSPQRTIEVHRHAVYCVAFAADGRRLASASADKTARVFDVATGATISSFTQHSYPVTTVRFAPDGKRVCSTSYQRPKGGEVRIWDPADGRELALLQSGYAPITCSHWSVDGSRIAAASWDQQLHVFDLSAPERPTVVRLGPEGGYRAAQASALTADGALLAVACKDDQIHLFEPWNGTSVRDLVGHTRIVEGVAFSPDGATLASGSADSSVRLWDAGSGRPLARLLGHRGVVRALVFVGPSRLLTGSADGTVRLWDVPGAPAVARRTVFDQAGYHAAESPDGKLLAIGFADGQLALHSPGDGTRVDALGREDDWVGCVQFSPDGSLLASAGARQLLVWDLGERAIRRALSVAPAGAPGHGCGGGVDAIAWSHGGRLLAAVSRDHKARAWRVATGDLLWTAEFAGQQVRLAFSPDDATVAIAGQAGAALHDAATGELRIPLRGHRGRVTGIRFTPDGSEVLTLGEDGTLRAYRAADGTAVAQVRAHDGNGRAAEMSPDGRRLATCGEDDRLVVWDVATRAAVWSRDVKDAYSLAWSRDGQRLWVLTLERELIGFDAVPARQRQP
ncbi:MAG: WD40 repeat domain-containing protein [Planctomycetes bacterium]|nr:WD40 repeat domain-containing protein [Planctomycetota bacterium]